MLTTPNTEIYSSALSHVLFTNRRYSKLNKSIRKYFAELNLSIPNHHLARIQKPRSVARFNWLMIVTNSGKHSRVLANSYSGLAPLQFRMNASPSCSFIILRVDPVTILFEHKDRISMALIEVEGSYKRKRDQIQTSMWRNNLFFLFSI